MVNPIKNTSFTPLISLDQEVPSSVVTTVAQRAIEDQQTTISNSSSSSFIAEIILPPSAKKTPFLGNDVAVAPEFFSDMGTNKQKIRSIAQYLDEKHPNTNIWFIRESSKPGAFVLTTYNHTRKNFLYTRFVDYTLLSDERMNDVKNAKEIDYNELLSIEKKINPPIISSNILPLSPEEIEVTMHRNYERAQKPCGKISEEEKQILNEKLSAVLKRKGFLKNEEKIDSVCLIEQAWLEKENRKRSVHDPFKSTEEAYQDQVEELEDQLKNATNQFAKIFINSQLAVARKSLHKFQKSPFQQRTCAPPKIEKINGHSIEIIEEKAKGEDAWLATAITLGEHTGNLYAVFDGHGGPQVAHYLREHLTSTIQHSFENIPQGESLDFQIHVYKALEESIKELNRQILSDDAMHTIGSTLTAVLSINHRLYTINLGDSAAYAVHNGNVMRLTTPDVRASLVSLLKEPCLDTIPHFLSKPSDLLNWRTKNGLAVNASIGDRDQDIDFHRNPTISILPADIPVDEVEVFLASDGLHERVKIEEYLQFTIENGLEIATNAFFKNTGTTNSLGDDLTVIRAAKHERSCLSSTQDSSSSAEQ